MEQIIDVYHVDYLHPNIYLQFRYACALFYMVHGKQKEALYQLNIFVECSIAFIKEGVTIHGDSYFTEIERYFQRFDQFGTPPRGLKIICDSVLTSLENPTFAPIAQTNEMKRWKQRLKEGREKI